MTVSELKNKILKVLTIPGVVVAQDPYSGDYAIEYYQTTDALTIDFYTKDDAQTAEELLAKYFDWTEIHQLKSYKNNRWMLYVSSKELASLSQRMFSTH